MTIRRRIVYVLLVLAGMVLILAVGGVLVLRSQWFYEKVRAEIIRTVETATGGRAEIASFDFNWKTLRAEVRGFVLHGSEPAAKPPLFRASSISIGLRIVSAFKRDIDIQSLDIADPRVYLLVNPDGTTNVPEPKLKRGNANPAETILDLAIGRFNLQNGVFEVESHGKTPLDAQGRNLKAIFTYELAGPRYRGDLSIQPLDVHIPGMVPLGFAVTSSWTVEKNRIALTSGRIATGATSVDLSGTIADLSAPHGTFQYDARVSLTDLSRIAHVPELERGTVQLGGNLSWTGAALSATGNLHGSGVDYRDSTIRLRGGKLDGAVTASLDAVVVTGARLSTTYVTQLGQLPIDGRIATITLRDRDLDLRDVALATLGGTFRGNARLRDFKRYSVSGEIAGFEAKKIVALYSSTPLPWDGRAYGPVHVEGMFKQASALRAGGNFTVAPAAEGPPVRGQINAAFDAGADTIDVGRSTLSLPSSRADFSGVYGREMQAHLETRDLNDLLPILGASAASLPVKLERGGSAVFNGAVSGPIDHPQFTGNLTATSFSVEGRTFDSLAGDVAVSPENARSQNLTLTRGSLRAQFQAAIRLNDWKAGDDSQIFASGAIRNAVAADILALLDLKNVPVTGTINGGAQITGTLGNPGAAGDIEVTKGSFQEEPFDRFKANVAYQANTITVTSGEIAAGGKQAHLGATYHFNPAHFDSGRLQFRVSTNPMQLEEIQTLQELRPGLIGQVEVTGSGDLELTAGKGLDGIRIADLHADVNGHNLQFSGQPLGDARLTANSQAGLLKAHLDASFADAGLKGDGEWRLEGDYPGTATISFSRLNFSELRAWLISPDSTIADRIAGSTEGELRISGPARKPDQLKAELRLPKLEIGPTPAAGVPASLGLKNDGPIVASMTNSVITVESARLTGRATDISVTGKITLQPKNPLDLRVNGKIDLALIRDFNRDFLTSGSVIADGTVRGDFDSPQINGRMQVQDAAFNITDFPNGISKAAGVILFSGDRATIQTLTGETGGGKITLSGFAGFGGGEGVYRLRADVSQVRVRYPEGVSTVADAALTLTGTSDRSTVAGTITVLRTGFNPQSDFSSIIARSAEPVETPSSRSGFLGGVNFDVQIETAPDIQFQSSLTQDLQVEANLRLRGTLSNPALVGRINITQGQVVFYGTNYHINQGSISFYNPLKVDPILDIDLETKARGIDVTLTITGPLNKLNLTPRSDPPLQFNEIVALLATGRTPTSDPTMLAAQNTTPQSWQQMGASALLGQAIASPVAGRLQRFFGVSKLRIDPTLPGVENNPQARLTLEQQVTPDITFTYITNITTTNPQVVRVEWSFSKQWSVVALREENGVFGLDFFFKKRF